MTRGWSAASLIAMCVVVAACVGRGSPSSSGAASVSSEAEAGEPFPPQPDGAIDPEGAESAIRWAFGHLLRTDVDSSLRQRLIDVHTADPVEAEAVIDSLAAMVGGGQMTLERVHLVRADRAEVTFRVAFDRPELRVQVESSFMGSAVFDDGSWRVSAETACALAIAANHDCARTPDDPVSPAALHVGWTGPGMHVIADHPGCPDVVNLDDQRAWGARTGASLHLRTTHLTGLSRLTDAQLDMVLPALLGWTNAERTTTSGRLALTLTNMSDDSPPQPTTWLASVRTDDVLVFSIARNFSLDELNAVVDSLEPATPSSCPVLLPID